MDVCFGALAALRSTSLQRRVCLKGVGKSNLEYLLSVTRPPPLQEVRSFAPPPYDGFALVEGPCISNMRLSGSKNTPASKTHEKHRRDSDSIQPYKPSFRQPGDLLARDPWFCLPALWRVLSLSQRQDVYAALTTLSLASLE